MSILGHFIESTFFSNNGSGFLYSYWTPIYGIGAVIILIIYKYVNKTNLKRFSKIITLFIICAITLSFIEIIGGYLIKLAFHKELWNYTNHKFHIGKYTSLEMSLIWGLSSILFIYIIKPFVDKIVFKVPKFLSLVCISLFILDIIVTLVIKT